MTPMVLAVDIIHEHVEGALRELADEREQRRLWLSTGGEVSSLEECVERLFTDSGLALLLERPGVVYTHPIDDRLTLLRLAVSRVDEQRPPEEVLADPALHEVRALAQELLRLLNDLRYQEAGS